jgi:hypothetical protein
MAHTGVGDNASSRPLGEYLAEQTRWLDAEGFHPGEALAVTSSCRDELVADLRAGVRRGWDNAFDFSSLSGLPLAGVTGMRAVLDHTPEEVRRRQVVIFAMPHVGVLPDGTYGQVMRRGRSRATTACGSLVAAAIWAEDAADDPMAAELQIDPLDPEQSLVRARLLRSDPQFYRRPPLALARWVADLMLVDLWQLVESFGRVDDVDVAVVLAVLVNGADGDGVIPTCTRMRRNGVVVDVAAR